jgi:hypothetical protein
MREAIMSFHQLVSPAFTVRLPSYVMDVVVLGDVNSSTSSLTTQIIELNSYGADMSSGAGLFNWHIDHDIMYGEGAFADKDRLPVMRVLDRLLEADGSECTGPQTREV